MTQDFSLQLQCLHGISTTKHCALCTNDGHISGVNFDLAAWNKQVMLNLTHLETTINSQFHSSNPTVRHLAVMLDRQIQSMKDQLRLTMIIVQSKR